MPDVHPSAVLRGDVTLGDDVVIGPGCVLDGTLGPVTVGAGSKLLANVYLNGPLTAGAGNIFYPGTCIGFAPQSRDWDPNEAGRGVVIGDHNRFSECVSIHRATSHEVPTTVGSHVWFMNHTHAAHDVCVHDHVMIAGGAQLGGHVRVDEHATIGGNNGVHQYCRIGRGAMLCGVVPTNGDVPPFFTLTGFSAVGGPNVVGMRRHRLPADVRDDIRWAYKVIYQRHLPPGAAAEALKERAGRPMIDEYIEFIRTSRRGLCRGIGDARRSQARIEMAAAGEGP